MNRRVTAALTIWTVLFALPASAQSHQSQIAIEQKLFSQGLVRKEGVTIWFSGFLRTDGLEPTLNISHTSYPQSILVPKEVSLSFTRSRFNLERLAKAVLAGTSAENETVSEGAWSFEWSKIHILYF